MNRRLPWLFALAFLLGCTPEIGDQCVIATDCSSRGDRICDTSQPGGYCTVRDCVGNTCPDKAACVLFASAVPGCSYDDRAISRSARTFCIAQCETADDCRSGYECVDPRLAPWKGLILDDDQGQKTCLLRSASPLGGDAGASDGGIMSIQPPPVCSAAGPLVPPIQTTPRTSLADAGGAPVVDAGVGDAGLSDAGALDGGATDGGDGGADGGI